MVAKTGSTLGLLAALSLLMAACAPQTTGMATPAPTSSLSGPPNAGPVAGARGSGGMNHSTMAGMDMNAMMAHCAQMRQDVRPGQAASPDMRRMMSECDQMDRGMSMPMPRSR